MRFWIYLIGLLCLTHVQDVRGEYKLKTAARGYGLAGGQANTTLSFNLHLFDDSNTSNYTGYTNNITVWVSKGGDYVLDSSLFSFPTSIEDKSGGTYNISYGLLVVGKFHLHIAVNAVEIAHSPFHVSLTANNSCDSECGGHGICHVEGYCVCQDGFTANNCSIALGPTCYLAQISPSGTMLRLHFKPEVDIIGSRVQTCSDIIAYSMLSKLGKNPVCTWYNSTVFSVSFGNGASLLPDDSIIVVTRALVSLLVPSLPPPATVTIRVEPPPLNEMYIPVGIVSAPVIMHNPCVDLVLDSTSSYHSGGRPMALTWGTQQQNGSLGILINYLATMANHSIVTIPAKYIPQLQGDLVFTLSLRNYLGASSIINVPIHFASPRVLEVRVTPATVYVDAGSPVDLAGVVILPSTECVGVVLGPEVTYSWVRKSGPLVVLDGSSNTRVLHIPATNLIAGQSYEFELQVASVNAPKIRGTAVATVEVGNPRYAVHIAGGSRLHSLGDTLSLHADVIGGTANSSTATPLKWSVVAQNTGEYVVQDRESEGNTLLIPASFLHLGKYKVIAALAAYSVYDTVEVHTADISPLPAVFVKAPARVLAGESLVLEGGVGGIQEPESLIKYQWTSDLINLESEEFSDTRFSRILVIPSALLSPGVAVKFRLTATSPRQLSGWAEVLVHVGEVPTAGACSITPTTGIANVDSFSLQCKGWEGGAYPYTARIWRVTNSSDASATRIPLHEGWDPLGVTNFVLPAGTHTFDITISDRLGNRVSMSVQGITALQAPSYQVLFNQNPMSLISLLTSEFQNAIVTHDTGRQLQILPGIIDTLNAITAMAGPVKNYADLAYLARVRARENLANMLPSIPRNAACPAFVSYALSQIAMYPYEVGTATRKHLQEHISEISTANGTMDYNTIKSHLGTIHAYFAAEIFYGATVAASNLVHSAVMKLAQVSVSTQNPAHSVGYSSREFRLVTANPLGAQSMWTEDGVRVYRDGNIAQTVWQVIAVSWPFNLYPDSSIGTYVREVLVTAENLPIAARIEVELATLKNVKVTNDSIVECRSWNAVSSTWTPDICTLEYTTPHSVVCSCVSSSTIAVAAYIQQPETSTGFLPELGDNSIQFSMLSQHQWGLIIGVGMIGIAILLGVAILSRVRMSKQGSDSLFLNSYVAILHSDEEEPDVTIDDLSEVETDDASANYALSFSDLDSNAYDSDFADSMGEETESQGPNSTRLSRMGVQEGATGYVVSSTTLRNTLETDYDLEKKENNRPITGTALRIRAQSLSTEAPVPSSTTTTARPKIGLPSISRASGARLGLARGDSLRAFPSFLSPNNTTN